MNDVDERAQSVSGASTDQACETDISALSRDELVAILEGMQDTFYRTDKEGKLTHLSRSVRRLLGYMPEELIGKRLSDLYVEPDGREKFLAVLQASNGNVLGYEAPLRHKQGYPVWVSTNSHYCRDAQGEIIGIEGMARDITQRRHEQQELSRLKGTLDRTLDCVFMFEPESLRFFYFNEGAMKQVGYSAQELLLMRPFDIKPAIDETRFREMLEPLLRGERDSITFETLHRHKAGHDLPVEIFMQYIVPEAEAPRFVAFVRDVSERKQADTQMRKLSMALEQTADAVAITDCDGIIEYVNAAFEIITGYSRGEAVGQAMSILNSGAQDDAFYQRLWNTVLAGEVFREIFINRRKDGSLYYEEKTITPLKDHAGRVAHFISAGKDITERMQAQQQLEYLAHHDALTGLPNRVLFIDRLDHALERRHAEQERVAVLFLDLDRFKVINDTLGHAVGDRVLQMLAERVGGCIRRGDTLARLSGDEFAIILEDVTANEGIAPIARHILAELASPFVVDEHELFVTTSIGISLSPNDGEDSHTLLKHADIAMYRAKDLGRNTYQFYSPDMSTKALERLSLETSLRYALERDQFRLFYQPQVDVRSGEIIGVEALLRWRHPDLGIVSPIDFIPILEETGLIVPVGEWVLHTACSQARLWQTRLGRPLRMAVNLSARQFNAADLVANVQRCLDQESLPPESLELEITESVIMQDKKWVASAFRALEEMGVRLAIDDFGTGYSSLSYLKRFPIDTLKIDRSFIRDITTDPDDAAIVTAIIAMARGLKLKVIAEGVETLEQLAFVRDQQCTMVQGFLFSQPLTAEELDELLATGLPRHGAGAA